MANLKASKKDILVNKRNKERNKAYKTRLKTLLKQVRVAIDEKSDQAAVLLKEVLKAIDKTCSKGVLKKQKANRLKSKLSIYFNTKSA